MNNIKKVNAYLCMLFSAVLYAMAFFLPPYFWWTVFVFPIPLLWAGIHFCLGFWHGYAWGFTLLALHLYGVLTGVFGMARGSFINRITPCIGIVLYQAFFAGLIFLAAQHIIKYFSLSKNKPALVCIWSCASYAFLWYMDTSCLLPFDRWEGYALIHPLIPLAQHPHLLNCLPSWGSFTLTTLLFALPTSAMFAYTRRTLSALLLHCCFLGVWIAMACARTHAPQTPTWLKVIQPLARVYLPHANLTVLATHAAEEYNALIVKNPATELIVMPESSFYCNSLGMPAVTQLWAHNYLGKPVHIITGSFRWNGRKYHNSLHWIYDGKLQTCFDKRHAMAFTERVPHMLKSKTFSKIFFSQMPEITASDNPRPLIRINNDCNLVPYICSELFFNPEPDDGYGSMPILAICNDRVFKPYIAYLMMLGARHKAIMWQRPIVYISFKHQLFFDAWGNQIELPLLNNEL